MKKLQNIVSAACLVVCGVLVVSASTFAVVREAPFKETERPDLSPAEIKFVNETLRVHPTATRVVFEHSLPGGRVGKGTSKSVNSLFIDHKHVPLSVLVQERTIKNRGPAFTSNDMVEMHVPHGGYVLTGLTDQDKIQIKVLEKSSGSLFMTQELPSGDVMVHTTAEGLKNIENVVSDPMRIFVYGTTGCAPAGPRPAQAPVPVPEKK